MRAFPAFVLALLLPGSEAVAKCYLFSNGGAIRVCVRGDTYAHRKKAGEICRRVKGSHCGAVANSYDSCKSKSKQCYDEEGRAHESLDGY